MLATYLKFAGAVILIGIGCLILFSLLGVVWAAWGAFGALVFVGLGLALFAWIYDRRHTRDY